MYKAYLRYEYTVARNMSLFLGGENYFLTDNRIIAGMTLNCWNVLKLKFGLEGKSTSARAFVG